MAYCELKDIQQVLPQLPAGEGDPGYANMQQTVLTHIRRVDGLINGKCARRYPVPFSPVPPFVRTIAEDLVTYMSIRSFYSQDNQNRTDYLDEYESALKDLDSIMNGGIDLVDTTGSSVAERTDEVVDMVSSNTQGYQPFFGIDDATEWDFDQDRKDDLRDDRE